MPARLPLDLCVTCRRTHRSQKNATKTTQYVGYIAITIQWLKLKATHRYILPTMYPYTMYSYRAYWYVTFINWCDTHITVHSIATNTIIFICNDNTHLIQITNSTLHIKKGTTQNEQLLINYQIDMFPK